MSAASSFSTMPLAAIVDAVDPRLGSPDQRASPAFAIASASHHVASTGTASGCCQLQRGFSMVELMIAMVLGLLLVEGILLLFSETSRVNAHQAALARLQESGRFALATLDAELRQAGQLPCGLQTSPLVFADALSSHIPGSGDAAHSPPGWANGHPYPLDRGLFAHGHECSGSTCVPELSSDEGVPAAGAGDGERIPGTDVLTVRRMEGAGWAVDGGGGSACVENAVLEPIVMHKLPGDSLPSAFQPGHLALLAGCSAAQVLSVLPQGGGLQPLTQSYGAPTCVRTGEQTRIFDLDEQLRTSSYYLASRVRSDASGQIVPVLMQRINGVDNELVEGVERLDFRYSLTDRSGGAHWLTAAQVAHSVAADGSAVQCADDATAPARSCAWADVRAVDMSILVNTVADLPADTASHAWDYRYQVDGDGLQVPGAIMPVTGLAPGRKLRREFRSVVALRSLHG